MVELKKYFDGLQVFLIVAFTHIGTNSLTHIVFPIMMIPKLLLNRFKMIYEKC